MVAEYSIEDQLHSINDFVEAREFSSARNNLIVLLDHFDKLGLEYTPLLNHLIRKVGLYPYIQYKSADWQDRFVLEAFRVDSGDTNPVTIHIEQSKVLKKLLDGQDIAVSAPTSFGKSFIVDSFIAIRKPINVVIIVPTLALTDETRRRIQKKFSHEYKVITTSETELGEKNILIFPQERALHYIDHLDSIDILIIDEFYKINPDYDKERSPALVNTLMQLGAKAKQQYFLAPNIASLKENPFTKGIEFIKIDFNTVFLNKFELFDDIGGDEERKFEALNKILSETKQKSLIYAGTYTEIDKVSKYLLETHETLKSYKLHQFANWLSVNYIGDWDLVNLSKKGVGIHNGRLHRSISQLQIKLFEDHDGLDKLISTSSIVEGVNTSAKNVILWRNKSGIRNLDDFTYRNIIGRAGRMFKHFVGNVYVLEPPPAAVDAQLTVEFPDALVGKINENDFKRELTGEQVAKIISYKEEMSIFLGASQFEYLQRTNAFQIADSGVIKAITKSVFENPSAWHGLGFFNSDDPDDWHDLLFSVINLQRAGWEGSFTDVVNFVKVLSKNWVSDISELLAELEKYNIGIDEFFKLEKVVTFKLTALLHDLNLVQKIILSDKKLDISSFISRVAYAFLPPIVYQLEEYGLPRMISKKLHESGVVNFLDEEMTLHDCIELLSSHSITTLRQNSPNLQGFDLYILEYFLDGLTVNKG